MYASRPCRRCGHWHDGTVACDQVIALQLYLPVTVRQQANADAAEITAIARYRLGPKP
jgi:hypothetical protein